MTRVNRKFRIFTALLIITIAVQGCLGAEVLSEAESSSTSQHFLRKGNLTSSSDERLAPQDLTKRLNVTNYLGHHHISLLSNSQTRPYLSTYAAMFFDHVFHRPLVDSINRPTEPPAKELDSPPSSKYCICGTTWNHEMSHKKELKDEIRFSDFPWRVYFGSDRHSGMKTCTGTIIHELWILTSVTCLMKFAPTVYIYTEEDSTLTGRIRARSRDWVFHPDFNATTFDNDIALIKLQQPLHMSPNILPICLPWRLRYHDFSRTTVTASAFQTPWGSTSNLNLQSLQLPFYSTAECHHALKQSGHEDEVFTENMVCTNGDSPNICNVTFGGSLDYYDEGSKAMYSIGIPLDMNYDCGPRAHYYPQVATKLTHYLTWILRSTMHTEFCVPR